MSRFFDVVDGKLFVQGKAMPLDFAVSEVEEFPGGVVVRIDVPPGERCNRNVYFVTDEGQILWRIGESPHGTQADKPFMRIWRDESGTLVASNWNGVDYEVDVSSGRLGRSSLKK